MEKLEKCHFLWKNKFQENIIINFKEIKSRRQMLFLLKFLDTVGIHTHTTNFKTTSFYIFFIFNGSYVRIITHI